MPTPADIVAIIDPPAPTPDTATYIAIKEKIKGGHTFVSDQERAYASYCERFYVDQFVDYRKKADSQEGDNDGI